eukprot:TRINITY_DN5452_c0_g1_i2.p1 TRINITY_DN5452_c0_g1~~TRINITY_DN5452_c0_g1_i2.p1  ORF type:complete len:247 (+),score=62.25 TRINITY_DN5452_c0_g1_i2:108-743(+)
MRALLVGLPGSGKSTIFKMCKIIQQNNKKSSHHDPSPGPSLTIEVARFTFQNMGINVFNIGCHRPERKKWMSWFEARCIIFVVSLACYDSVTPEGKNEMEETFLFFEEILKFSQPQKIHILLFLNKSDLFDEKCQQTSIKVCKLFADYDSKDDDPVSAKEFIKDKFIKMAESMEWNVQVCYSNYLQTDIVLTIAVTFRRLLLSDHITALEL